MNLPYFFKEDLEAPLNEIQLDEDSSKHVVQVLRMKAGDKLQLTDGKGNLITASITDENRKKCVVRILSTAVMPEVMRKVAIAISPVKNNSRFEWFLEKATELGVSEIIPVICERTEKQHFRMDRMKNILVSAMLQSRQCRFPVLHEPMGFEKLWQSSKTLPKLEDYPQKFIAHCMDAEKRNLADVLTEKLNPKIILIGPEGDFTPAEIESALQHDFIPVALGETRLRTETAGIVAASLLCLV